MAVVTGMQEITSGERASEDVLISKGGRMWLHGNRCA